MADVQLNDLGDARDRLNVVVVQAVASVHGEAFGRCVRSGFLDAIELSGLLGTVTGLIKSFGAVSGASVDPSQKATILANGISEAMNCTAFGLGVAIIGLIGFAVLNGKTQGIEDDINEASVQVLNLVIANRQKVNVAAVGQAA